MILVTGAGGKTGRAVLAALTGRTVAWRALVRQPAALPDSVRDHGEIVVGDMLSQGEVARAVQDVSAIYHIPPNMHPAELPMAELLLETARQASIERFVYHSVLHPQSTAMPHHARKLLVEEAVIDSGLPFTLLQPAAYMQNLASSLEQVRQQGRLVLPYPPSTRLNLVDLADVARAAAAVLIEAGHLGATYELAGPSNPNQHEVAGLLAELLGRPVEARQQSLVDWRRAAEARGLDAQRIEDFLAMFAYYGEHDFIGNSRSLTQLLGRRPTDLRAFLSACLPT